MLQQQHSSSSSRGWATERVHVDSYCYSTLLQHSNGLLRAPLVGCTAGGGPISSESRAAYGHCLPHCQAEPAPVVLGWDVLSCGPRLWQWQESYLSWWLQRGTM